MMAKTNSTGMGLNASLKPKLFKQKKTKVARVRNFGIPGLGRIAFSKDPGEANLFSEHFLKTRLSAIVRDPYGYIVEEHDLGSGVVTNLGVFAMAYDATWPAEAKKPHNVFSTLQWHQWGTGITGTAETYNWKLETQAEVETAKFKAIKATTTVKVTDLYSTRKWVSTATLEAGGNAAITEWGLFNAEEPKGAEETGGTAAPTETTFTGEKSGSFVESTTEALGSAQSVIWTKNTGGAAESVGLILSCTKEVATIPAKGWIKAASEAEAPNPEKGTKYNKFPLMWDRRKFEPINVAKGNTITFPYELRIEAGS